MILQSAKSLSDMNQEEVGELLKNTGKHLAYLLYQAPLSPEDKKKIIEVLPNLSIEQIEKLIDILEAGIEMSTGDVAKNELAAKIADAVEGFEQKIQVIDDQANAQFDELEKEFIQLEK